MGTLASKQAVVYEVSYAPTDRATCKRCKNGISKGELRLTRKDVPNNWTGDKGAADMHFHLQHGFDALANMRCVQTDKWGASGFPNPRLLGLDSVVDAKHREKVEKCWHRAVSKLMNRCKK